MNILIDMPRHKECQNCGECCGPVPASKNEIKVIKGYLENNPHIFDEIGKVESLTCIFRSEKEKKCYIYPVRPIVCRLMGVAKGLVCKNGNSANIDGCKFLDKSFVDKPELLNFVRWDK